MKLVVLVSDINLLPIQDVHSLSVQVWREDGESTRVLPGSLGMFPQTRVTSCTAPPRRGGIF